VPPSRQGLRDAGLDLIETERPSFVLDGMVLVPGQVARTNAFETGSPPHPALRNGVLEPYPLICDDQALVIHVRNKGLVVLTGCGHAGIINTIEYAQCITRVPTVHDVVGGFHLGPETFQARVKRVVESLVRLNPSADRTDALHRVSRDVRRLPGVARGVCTERGWHPYHSAGRYPVICPDPAW
jgi:7,8-dihydropterin-6-yl-methyl-4-(beta-D-ribofuranosyl)aminobenzene 5'-phosphate synthase